MRKKVKAAKVVKITKRRGAPDIVQVEKPEQSEDKPLTAAELRRERREMRDIIPHAPRITARMPRLR